MVKSLSARRMAVLVCLSTIVSCGGGKSGSAPDIAYKITFERSPERNTLVLRSLPEVSESSKIDVHGGGGSSTFAWLFCTQQSGLSTREGQIQISVEEKEQKIRVEWDLAEEGVNILLEAPDGKRHLLHAFGKGQAAFRYREAKVGGSNHGNQRT
jgi:hypothetical protein